MSLTDFRMVLPVFAAANVCMFTISTTTAATISTTTAATSKKNVLNFFYSSVCADCILKEKETPGSTGMLCEHTYKDTRTAEEKSVQAAKRRTQREADIKMCFEAV